jgi:hypothetical protein
MKMASPAAPCETLRGLALLGITSKVYAAAFHRDNLVHYIILLFFCVFEVHYHSITIS